MNEQLVTEIIPDYLDYSFFNSLGLSDQHTVQEETSLGNENITEALFDESSSSMEGATGGALDAGDVFSTLEKDACADIRRIPLLSENLHEAMANINELEDIDIQVDNVIGNILKSIRMDGAYVEAIHHVDQVAQFDKTKDILRSCKTNEQFSSTSCFQSRQCVKQLEERLLRKERIRKEKHNIIERRRRLSINDRMKELGSLLPKSVHGFVTYDKGSILKSAVEYIKEMKKEKEVLTAYNKKMESKYKTVVVKMLTRVCQLEIKMKLNEIKEEVDGMKTKNKLHEGVTCAFESMVEEMRKNNTPAKSPEQSSTVAQNAKLSVKSPQIGCTSTVQKTCILEDIRCKKGSVYPSDRNTNHISGNGVLSSLERSVKKGTV